MTMGDAFVEMLRNSPAFAGKGSGFTLTRDGQGRFQCSYQRERGSAFSVHVANDPIEAIAGALDGLDGIRAIRAFGKTNPPESGDLDDLL